MNDLVRSLFDEQVRVAEALEEYIVRLVAATRTPGEFGAPELAPLIRFGAGPRASVGLLRAARALAHLAGRDYALPDDVHVAAVRVLRHRVLLSFEAEAEQKNSADLVRTLLTMVEVP